MKLKSGYYRVSVKALIWNERHTHFLLTQANNLEWELPGGGLNWGEKPQEGLAREIKEEMNIDVDYVAMKPDYFITMEWYKDTYWTANVIYDTRIKGLDFTQSAECIDAKFYTLAEAKELKLSIPTQKFLEVFDLANHK